MASIIFLAYTEKAAIDFISQGDDLVAKLHHHFHVVNTSIARRGRPDFVIIGMLFLVLCIEPLLLMVMQHAEFVVLCPELAFSEPFFSSALQSGAADE
jgi:hypothetical protein